jgi:hypothetical protein
LCLLVQAPLSRSFKRKGRCSWLISSLTQTYFGSS